MEPSGPQPVQPGRLLDGRYRLLARIARGGMASVFEAHDVRLDRTVAVKVMHPGLVDSPADPYGGDDHRFAERFVREARAAARLTHPNVVAVYDQGDDDGTVFLVMELVTGHTLRDLVVKESPMPPGRALALLEPVLSALAAAHRAGLVHRDVKPENVLIAPDPDTGASRVKVADFGLARAVNAETQHTATQGVLIGTVSYLAPELVVDGRADARADVYAAGVVLYELLTGRKPHAGESPIQVAYRHVHHDVPAPSLLAPDLPPYVDALVARATARDRSLRPADAGVLLHQVRRVAQAVADGVRDDPELTVDLTPVVRPVADSSEATDPFDREELASFEDFADAVPDVVESPAELPLTPPPPTRPLARPTTPPPTVPAPVRERTRGLPVEHAVPAFPRPPGHPPGHAPRRRRRWRGPVVMLLALLLAVGLGGGAFWYGWARYTTAPAVVGEVRDEAEADLAAAGFEVGFADPVYHSDAPEGTVVRAEPGAGTRLLPGDTVILTVSLGELLVPGVRGRDLATARAALVERQLEPGEEQPRFSETRPEGTVLGTRPPAGTEVEPGDRIDLIVSAGREPIPVGRWVGREADVARERLDARGLAVEVTEDYDEQVPAGSVISQQPERGTLFRDDVVSLVVSLGPPLVEVPSVRLSGVEAAEQTLRDAGFDVVVEEDDVYYGLGFVVSTDPPAGEMAPMGSTITVYIV